MYTTHYNLGSEERGQCWRGMSRERFLFPFNKGHSRVYLNAYGHDLVGGRALVVPLMKFDWKRKEGDAGKLCCLLCVEYVLGTMLSGWHRDLIFTVFSTANWLV